MSTWIKFITKFHIFIYRLSNGYLGGRLGRQSILLINTIGRKSGKMHTTTLAYYRDDEMYLVVGSNWGKENHPGWYYNLMEHPRTTIQVASKLITVEARPAQGDDYQRLWQMVCKQNDQYIHYQKMIKRRIPVVVLVPIKPS